MDDYKDSPSDNSDAVTPQDVVNGKFLASLYTQLQELEGEVSERNEHIQERDQFIYSDKLERSIDIPIGHDFTPINWLRRTVEIHKTMFMGRPFQAVSVYDTQDLSMASDDQDRQRKEIENKKEKAFAEARRNLIDGIVRDNGGHALFLEGAESASAVGSWVVKTWYDTDNDKFVISPVEAVENTYAVWSSDNFREFTFFAYGYQVSKQRAAEMYGLDEDDLQTSPLGSPFVFTAGTTGVQVGGNNSTAGASSSSSGQTVGQPMVTIVEGTGKLEGWCVKGGKLYSCAIGSETELNCVYVGGKLVRLIYDKKKLPKYYIFPNRRERRRSWGKSDITDAAININVTYIETLSDWRTIAAKINFPKLKGFNFGPDTTLPKFQARKIQLLPLADGQDLMTLNLGSDNSIDWSRQLDELKQLFVRETGVSRVLFDDPSVTLNSNQALLTSMKPTSDIAENKKQLWSPILTQLFTDAIETIANHKPEFKDLAEGNWSLKIQWPSIMQKEDPVFQQMLLNRWNAGTISFETYLEMQGETKDEIDRIRDEIDDPITAAILAHQVGEVAKKAIYEFIGMPPWGYITPKVSLKGDLAPQEVGNMAHNYQWDQGPYGPNIGPQGIEGSQANQDTINSGFIKDTKNGPQAIYQAPTATQANNTPGTQPVSQPGSGATPVTPQGALSQTSQQAGQ